LTEQHRLFARGPDGTLVKQPRAARCSVLPIRLGGLRTSLRNNGSSSRDRGTAPEDEK
jgi:hypothetical protein